mgnify:CR=1 FL=1
MIENGFEILDPRSPKERRAGRIRAKSGDFRIAMGRLDHDKAVLGIEIGKRPIAILGRDIKRRTMPVRQQDNRQIPPLRRGRHPHFDRFGPPGCGQDHRTYRNGRNSFIDRNVAGLINQVIHLGLHMQIVQ